MTYSNQAVVKIVKGKAEGKCTLSAFEKVWEPRGWKIKKDKSTRSGGLTKSENSNEASTDEKPNEGEQS